MVNTSEITIEDLRTAIQTGDDLTERHAELIMGRLFPLEYTNADGNSRIHAQEPLTPGGEGTDSFDYQAIPLAPGESQQ